MPRVTYNEVDTIDKFRDKVRKQSDNLTLVLKVTNKCHQNCKYCYHLYNNSEDLEKDMDIELFKEAILKIGPAFRSLNLHMHGGEPLTLSTEKLEELFIFVNEYKEAVKDHQQVFPAIQTNLMLLTDEKLELIKKYNICISTSYDCSASKITRNMNPEKFIKNFQKTDHAGVINVVTSENLKDNKKHILDVGKVNETMLCNPVMPFCSDEKLKLQPGQYSKFVIERFNYDLENNIDFSWDVLRYIKPLITDSSDCVTSVCLNSIITITPEGKIKGCDVRNENEWYYGKVSDINNYYDIYNLENYQKFEEMYFNLLKRCSDCEYFNQCNGGCLNRTTMINGELYKDSYCYDARILIQYFKEYIEKNKDNLPWQIKNQLGDGRHE